MQRRKADLCPDSFELLDSFSFKAPSVPKHADSAVQPHTYECHSQQSDEPEASEAALQVSWTQQFSSILTFCFVFCFSGLNWVAFVAGSDIWIASLACCCQFAELVSLQAQLTGHFVFSDTKATVYAL